MERIMGGDGQEQVGKIGQRRDMGVHTGQGMGRASREQEQNRDVEVEVHNIITESK